jgi:O-antigen/teichoic acid export membrane protein
VVLARVIGKHAFGQFAMIQSTVLTLTNLAGLGLGITATKFVSQYRTTEPARAGRILGLSSIIALVAGLCFSIGLLLFAALLAPDGTLVPALRLSALYVFFITLNGYQIGALSGLEAFRRIAQVSIVCSPLMVLATWLLASSFGLRGGVLAQGVGALLTWFQYHRAMTAEGRLANITIRYRGAWQERSALYRFSVPAVSSSVIGAFAIWCCNEILVKNSGYASLAVFAASSSLRSMVLFLPAVVARVTSPLLNNLLASGEVVAYRHTFWTAVASNGGFALLLATILSFMGTYILRLFGKDFVGSSTLLLVLLGSGVLEVVASNLYQSIFTARSLWWHVAIIIVWAAVLFSTSKAFVASYGAVGLALSYLVAWSISGGLYGTLALLQQSRLAGHAALSSGYLSSNSD